jgi:hypothetical protein
MTRSVDTIKITFALFVIAVLFSSLKLQDSCVALKRLYFISTCLKIVNSFRTKKVIGDVKHCNTVTGQYKYQTHNVNNCASAFHYFACSLVCVKMDRFLLNKCR